MKKQTKPTNVAMKPPLVSELLILPDGRILVHNLTPAFAGLLKELNPNDEHLSSRVETHAGQASHLSPSK